MKKTIIPILICLTLFANADSWTPMASFPSNIVAEKFKFSLAGKGYVGGGYALTGFMNLDFWEFDPLLNSWSQKADFGGTVRYGAASFCILNKGYVGLGYYTPNSTYTYYSDFWEYDPVANLWSQKAIFPGTARSYSSGFSIGNKAFVVGGHNVYGLPYYNDTWQYDATLDAWIQKANCPGLSRIRAFGFSIGNKGYIGTGYPFLNDLWEYDITLNAWTQKAVLPGLPRSASTAFVLNNKGYIGTGEFTNGTALFLNDFWEYNPDLNLWTQKLNFPASARARAISFTIGNKGYMGLGAACPPYFYADFYEYTPDNPTAINETTNSKLDFIIYPNPAKSFITINSSINEKNDIEIKLTNASGKNVFQDKLNNQQLKLNTRIDVSFLTKGIYFFDLNVNGERIVRKFIKV